MGWWKDFTDSLGVTSHQATRDANEAAGKADIAKKKAEAEAAAILKKQQDYNTSLQELAAQNAAQATAPTDVVAGGTADTSANDLLKKKKTGTTLSTQLGINV